MLLTCLKTQSRFLGLLDGGTVCAARVSQTRRSMIHGWTGSVQRCGGQSHILQAAGIHRPCTCDKLRAPKPGPVADIQWSQRK